MADPNNDNYANQCNPNHDAYWQSRGEANVPTIGKSAPKTSEASLRGKDDEGGENISKSSGKGQGNAGGWPSTTGNKSGGGRSNGGRGK